MILMYHHVCPQNAVPTDAMPLEGWRYCISPEDFRGQLLRLRRLGWDFVSLADYIKGLTERPDTRKVAAITFDDGWLDNFVYAVPILQELDVEATIFVVSGEMCGVPWKRRMSTAQLRSLHQTGVEVGAHTRSHPNLTQLNEQQLNEELAGCRDDIENTLGRQVRYLAYPGGRFNSRVVEAAQSIGYEAACSVIGSGCNSLESKFWLFRDVFSDQMDTWVDWIKLQPVCRRALHFRARRRAVARLKQDGRYAN